MVGGDIDVDLDGSPLHEGVDDDAFGVLAPSFVLERALVRVSTQPTFTSIDVVLRLETPQNIITMAS